jgi:hypothetical protein
VPRRTGLTLTGLVLTGLVLAGHASPADVPAPAPATAAPDAAAATASGPQQDLALVSHRKAHPDRRLKRYRVRPGDTVSRIAVRHHAWTRELVRMNHGHRLVVGEVITIPVVVAAARACDRHRHHRSNVGPGRDHTPTPKKSSGRPGKAGAPGRSHASHGRGWWHDRASRATVRRTIVTTARHHGVNPDLALAISWQESGWQQRRVSSANALGAMQVLPSTARWMSTYVGKRLNPRDLQHNVTAGVVLIKVLRSQARRKVAVAGYYQGLAGVRRHGMYRDTKRYVANVVALQERIAGGWNPA